MGGPNSLCSCIVEVAVTPFNSRLHQGSFHALKLERTGHYVAAAYPAPSYSEGQILGATGGGGQPA
jgi:hypothetical protein